MAIWFITGPRLGRGFSVSLTSEDKREKQKKLIWTRCRSNDFVDKNILCTFCHANFILIIEVPRHPRIAVDGILVEKKKTQHIGRNIILTDKRVSTDITRWISVKFFRKNQIFETYIQIRLYICTCQSDTFLFLKYGFLWNRG